MLDRWEEWVVDLSMTEKERINLLTEVMQKIEPVLIRQVGLIIWSETYGNINANNFKNWRAVNDSWKRGIMGSITESEKNEAVKKYARLIHHHGRNLDGWARIMTMQ